MRFIYATDVHDRFKSLISIFEGESADLAIISGDLLYRTFYSDDNLYDFISLQETFYTRARAEKLDLLPFDYAKHILTNQDSYPESAHKEARQFEELFEFAAKNIKQKYENLSGVIETYARCPAYLLPGNYDMDLKYTCLAEKDLHKKKLVVDGIVFSAYGGAPIMTPGIPEKMSVNFVEGRDLQSNEPYTQFMEHRPDVILVHQPPYGVLDRIPSVGHVGSNGIRTYLDDNQVMLCLSGHVHEDYGFVRTGSNRCLNPSNFGKVDSLYGENPGGYYAVIDIERSGLKAVHIRRIVDESIVPMVSYTAENDWQPQVENEQEVGQAPQFVDHLAVA